MTLLLMLTGYPQGGQGIPEAPLEGQPAMIRSQMIPIMPGYSDRPPKWNFEIDRPRILELLRLAIRQRQSRIHKTMMLEFWWISEILQELEQ